MKRILTAIITTLALAFPVQAEPQPPIDVATQITLGALHACALTATGGVKCWGDNNSGQLGRPTLPDYDGISPITPYGLESGVKQIAAGKYTTCAAMVAGGVKCWGYWGNDDLLQSHSVYPTSILSITGVISKLFSEYYDYHLTNGSGFCAIVHDTNGVKCWETYWDDAHAPDVYAYDIAGLTSGVTDLDIKGAGNCALMEYGGVKCWCTGVYCDPPIYSVPGFTRPYFLPIVLR